MSNFLDRLFRKEQSSAKTAKERLQFVLVTDRSQLSPEKMREMQAEILDVIRKYCRIDEDAIDMKLELRERMNYLVADIPLAKQANSDEDPGHISFALKTTTSEAPAINEKEIHDKKDDSDTEKSESDKKSETDDKDSAEKSK